MNRLLILLFVSTLMFGSVTLAFDSPSAEEILHKATENESKLSEARSRYTFRIHRGVHQAKKDGEAGSLISSEDYDVIFVNNRPYWLLVMRNGKPLNPKEAEKEKADMQKVAERNKEQEVSGHKKAPDYRPLEGGVKLGGLPDMLRLMNNTVLREEELNGRKAWVVQSEPKKSEPKKKDAVPKSILDRELLCYRQLFWIDQEDLVIAKREFVVLREFIDQQAGGYDLSLKPGSFGRWTYAKEGDGDWLPRTQFRYERRGFGPDVSFSEFRLVILRTYSEYKKFNVK